MRFLSGEGNRCISTSGAGVRMGNTRRSMAKRWIIHLPTLRAKTHRWSVSTCVLCRASSEGSEECWIREKTTNKFFKAMNTELLCSGCGFPIKGGEKIEGGGDSAQCLCCPKCGKETFVLDSRTAIQASDVSGKGQKRPKHSGAWSAWTSCCSHYSVTLRPMPECPFLYAQCLLDLFQVLR